MTTGVELADLARSLFEQDIIKYKPGGTVFPSFDGATFIKYCFQQLKIQVSFSGTNDLYRQAGKGIPISQAYDKDYVVPGALAFCVSHNGREPDKYKGDGLGNAEYAVICLNKTTGVYVSESRATLIDTKLEKNAGSGRPNTIVLCQWLDYSKTPFVQPVAGAVTGLAASTALVKTDLRLHKSPSTDADPIVQMPEGSIVEVVTASNNNGWSEVRFEIHQGWCRSEFLDFRG